MFNAAVIFIEQKNKWSPSCLCYIAEKQCVSEDNEIQFSLHLIFLLIQLVLVHASHRIAVFSVSVLHDERIVIVAEQRPDSTEEDSFQWMSRVLQVRLLKL